MNKMRIETLEYLVPIIGGIAAAKLAFKLADECVREFKIMSPQIECSYIEVVILNDVEYRREDLTLPVDTDTNP